LVKRERRTSRQVARLINGISSILKNFLDWGTLGIRLSH
jgi:hypothetical protein